MRIPGPVMVTWGQAVTDSLVKKTKWRFEKSMKTIKLMIVMMTAGWLAGTRMAGDPITYVDLTTVSTNGAGHVITGDSLPSAFGKLNSDMAFIQGALSNLALIPTQINSTMAQSNAWLSLRIHNNELTIAQLQAAVAALTNLVVQYGLSITNGYIAMGLDLTNNLYRMGTDTTNNWNQLGLDTTNNANFLGLDVTNGYLAMGLDLTNNWNQLGLDTTNNANQLGINVTNGYLAMGVDTTNNWNSLGLNVTNLIYAMGTDTTNNWNQLGLDTTNNANTLGINVTNLVMATGLDLTNLLNGIVIPGSGGSDTVYRIFSPDGALFFLHVDDTGTMSVTGSP